METLLLLFLFCLVAVALFKALAWTVKAGLFVILLPIKLMVALLAVVFTLLFLPLAIFPVFLLLLIPLVPLLLIALGIYLLVR